MAPRIALVAALAAALFSAMPVSAALYKVSYRSELTLSRLVPPFGDYTEDVVLRQGSIASGEFLFDGEALQLVGAAPRIHLENYRFYNDDDAMAQYIINNGPLVTPTDWSVDVDASLVELDGLGQLHFMLRAFRGVDIHAENRPFLFLGDTSMSKDLSWIAIGDPGSTWSSGGQQRVGNVAVTVSQVPEPAVAPLVAVALLAAAAGRRSGLVSARAGSATRPLRSAAGVPRPARAVA